MLEDMTLGYFQNHHRYVELNEFKTTIQADILEFVFSNSCFLSLLYQGALVLTIGYHQLEGAEQSLKKPFVVIEKSKEDALAGDAMEGSGDCSSAYKVRLLSSTGCLMADIKVPFSIVQYEILIESLL